MRYADKLGFILTQETTPGVWETKTVEHFAKGDVVQRAYRWDDAQSVNADLDITNQISIVYDNFFIHNMFALRWAAWQGKKWNVSRIELKPPRMILTLGKEYIEEGDHD